MMTRLPGTQHGISQVTWRQTLWKVDQIAGSVTEMEMANADGSGNDAVLLVRVYPDSPVIMETSIGS